MVALTDAVDGTGAALPSPMGRAEARPGIHLLRRADHDAGATIGSGSPARRPVQSSTLSFSPVLEM